MQLKNERDGLSLSYLLGGTIMAKYIATAIILPLLLVFVMQYGLEVKNDTIISRAENIVYSAKEEAKQQGRFTPDIIERMKGSLTKLGVSDSEIIIEVTTTPKYRTDTFDERELIEYKVGIPIKQLVAANSILGISDEANKRIHYVSGSTASELLLP